jgi:putative phosphoesterase
MLVGVVSDSHRVIDPALPGLLRGVDEIWHAGDLVTPDILDALRSIAPVVAVRGNNDVAAVVRDLPAERSLLREGHRILLRHIVGPPGRVETAARRSILRESPAIVVMGHSHQPLAEKAGEVVYLNPGSCGPRRFSLPRTAATLRLTRGEAHFVITDLLTQKPIQEARFTWPNASPESASHADGPRGAGGGPG